MKDCPRADQRTVTPTGESGVSLRAGAVWGLSLGQETVVSKTTQSRT